MSLRLSRLASGRWGPRVWVATRWDGSCWTTGAGSRILISRAERSGCQRGHGFCRDGPHSWRVYRCRMAVDFFFDPPIFSIPKLDALREHWKNIKDRKLRNVIAKEAQRLVFQRYLVGSIRF